MCVGASLAESPIENPIRKFRQTRSVLMSNALRKIQRGLRICRPRRVFSRSIEPVARGQEALPNAAMLRAIITRRTKSGSSIIPHSPGKFPSSTKGERMQAYRIARFGSVDGIVLRSSEDPRTEPKEILMQVRASSLNYRDLMVLRGGGRGPTKIGVVPLSGRRRCRSDRRRSYSGQNWRPDCGLLSSALVWRTDQARLLDRPARRQSRRNAGGICGLQ